MNTITAVLVDDEALARSLVREYLTSHPAVEIVAECANGFEAVKAITEMKPHLVFLDIQMPKLNGFEVIELLETPPAVIFVTAFDQFALKAFEVHAVDYLLKPFDKVRFDEALNHALQRLEPLAPHTVSHMAEEAQPRRNAMERVLIKDGSKVVIIPVDTIDYCEAQDDYVSIHAEGTSRLKYQRLAALEAGLDRSQFVRIHRSYILNVNRLAKLELLEKDSRIAILNDGTRLPVSRSGYDKLKVLL